MGESELPRTEVTKRIWIYIKEHNLQNPADKREILCDDALQKIFKKSKVHMFKMTKILSTVSIFMFAYQPWISHKIFGF